MQLNNSIDCFNACFLVCPPLGNMVRKQTMFSGLSTFGKYGLETMFRTNRLKHLPALITFETLSKYVNHNKVDVS